MQWLEATACGVDEAGRGPLAGPVVAAAVLLDPARPIDGLRDSKKLTPAARQRLALQIRADALAWAVGEASVAEIDRLNILQATLLAMRRAVEQLCPQPLRAVVDGNRCPPLTIPVTAEVQGDDRIAAIAAASILAKTVRDAQMLVLHAQYPEYGFASHMGYPTAAHRAALLAYGASPEHRRSFGPVRAVLQAGAAGADAPAGSRDF